jgi:hypothetical protein
MPSFGFIGPAYTTENPSVDPEDLVNLYPELIESGNGASKGTKYAYFNRPGLTLLGNIGGNGRALWGGNNRLFAVAGGDLVEVNQSGSIIHSYTIGNATGPAQIVFVPSGPGLTLPSSGALLVWDGSGPGSGGAANQNVWYVDGSTSTPPAVISGAGVGCIDGYGVVLRPAGSFPTDPIPINTIDGTQFNLSQIFVGNVWDPLQFGIKTGAPDQLQMIHTPGSLTGAGPEELWLFGKRSIEVWYDTGGSALDPFPFQRVPGAFIGKGCWAAFSVVAINGSLYWLGGDDRGIGIVYRADGYIPKRISTHAVEYAINSYTISGSDISDAIAYSYSENGHDFYVLNFPTAQRTWVYDVTENLWHRRAYNGPSTNQLGFYHAWAFGQHYLLDSSGNLYTSSIGVHQDAGTAITFQRTTPIIQQENKQIRHRQLEVHYGGPYSSTRNWTLEISNDGGQTYGTGITLQSGPGGTSPDRAIWRRAGIGRKRCYRLTTTDNLPQCWVDGYAEYEMGTGG